MPKYYGGVAFEKGKVVHENGEQEFVIAMTEEEAKDGSYREYLMEAEKEKSRDWLEKHPKVTPKVGSREALSEQFRDMVEYKKRRKESPNRKYY